MNDILVRLSYSRPLCSCMTKTPEIKYHDELCLHRVVREAEIELLRLRLLLVDNGIDQQSK